MTKPIVVSVGEPAGIGPDLCLGLAGPHESGPLVLIADPEQLAVRAEKLSVDIDISTYTKGSPVHGSALHVLPIDFANKDVCGTPDPANSSALLQGIERAVDGCSASLTIPNKSSRRECKLG